MGLQDSSRVYLIENKNMFKFERSNFIHPRLNFRNLQRFEIELVFGKNRDIQNHIFQLLVKKESTECCPNEEEKIETSPYIKAELNEDESQNMIQSIRSLKQQSRLNEIVLKEAFVIKNLSKPKREELYYFLTAPSVDTVVFENFHSKGNQR
mmetsp:Transcript_14845/g.13050  ORF Transcript_14845/g.13050 Transcript_14845/m.13050 type:complete len:152 (+) Transcript_14845:1258-1713(+)